MIQMKADDVEPALSEHWDGVMVDFMERDFPSGPLYPRQVPGWKCRRCGYTLGTTGLPPEQCHGCGVRWRT
jgi:rubrerythrin